MHLNNLIHLRTFKKFNRLDKKIISNLVIFTTFNSTLESVSYPSQRNGSIVIS